jgi:hypothetical protein
LPDVDAGGTEDFADRAHALVVQDPDIAGGMLHGGSAVRPDALVKPTR